MTTPKKGTPMPAAPPPPANAETRPQAPRREPVWSFPNRSRCPQCGSLETKAYASHDGVQMRRCQEPDCRWDYKVAGKLI